MIPTNSIFIFLLLILVTKINNGQAFQKIWENREGLKIPESVLYDENNDQIYVANINGGPAVKDGNGFISILNSNGTTKESGWIKKLNAPKGMAMYNRKLYVADIDELVEIDIAKGKITNTYKAKDALFLNDVTTCQNGMIFVSDTETAKIYVLHQGDFKVWLEGEPLKYPNGLLAERGKLYIGDQHLYEVDILTQKIDLVIENTGGIDGLVKNNNGDFIFSNWKGLIYMHKDGENFKIYDSVAEKINTADIDFAHKYELVLVPTFFDNRIIAYKIVY